MAGLPDGFDVNNPVCPKCDGPMWDNRAKKRSGDYKASRSDFSCKDKDGCGHGIWIDPPAKKGGQKKGEGAPASASPARMEFSPAEAKNARQRLCHDYFAVYMPQFARQMKKIATDNGIALSMADVQAATFSVVRMMADRRLLVDGARVPLPQREPPAPARTPAPARPAPAPVPAPKPGRESVRQTVPPEEFDDFPEALQDQEDDLPF